MRLIITESQLERLFLLEQNEDNYCTRDKFKPLFHVKNKLIENGIAENEITEDREYKNICRLKFSFPKNKNNSISLYEDGLISLLKTYNQPTYNKSTKSNTKSIQYTGKFGVNSNGDVNIVSFWQSSFTNDKGEKIKNQNNFSDSIKSIKDLIDTFNKPFEDNAEKKPTSNMSNDLIEIKEFLSGDVEDDDLNHIENVIKKWENSFCELYRRYNKFTGDNLFNEIRDAWVDDEVNQKRIVDYVYNLWKKNKC